MGKAKRINLDCNKVDLFIGNKISKGEQKGYFL